VSAARSLTSPLLRLRASRPRLEAVDRRDAALMSIGTLASGVLAYAFNVLAARSLGPESYGAIGALWAGMFLLAVLLFRPVEQTVSRAVAHRLARGEDARPAVRSAAKLTAILAALAVAGCLAAWNPLTDGLFGGEPVLTIALIAGVAGYAASYFARGLAGGVRWFGGYGLVLLADGAIRVLVAVPLLFVASPTIAAIAIAAAAIGGALAPLLSRQRTTMRRLEGAQGEDDRMTEAVRFALPAGVIAACEQILVSGGPLLVLIAGGEGAAAAAGVLFAATLLVRAPVFLFQGVAASLLPNLTTFRANGDEARLHRATALTALVLAGLAAVMSAAALAVGPAAMRVLYGDGFVASRVDLALLALGVGGFLAACTFCQALLARGQGGAAALRWSAAALTFVTLELALPGTPFHRVAVAFSAASALVGALLMVSVWRGRA
jgi:O-antigen/teichoic acid export membrane protein